MPNNITIISQGPVALLLRIVNYAVGLIELLLGLRFFLRLANANAANGFVAFIYRISDLFLVPFRSIFPRSVIEGNVFEWSTLFAMAMYAIAAFALMQLVLVLLPEAEVIETEHIDMDTLSNV